MADAQDPYLDLLRDLGGAYIGARYGGNEPAAPQPDIAYETSPGEPQTVYGGHDAPAINAQQTARYQTQVGGITFDTRFLWVSGLAVTAAVVLKALR